MEDSLLEGMDSRKFMLFVFLYFLSLSEQEFRILI